MEEKEFEVAMVFRQTVRYRVRATDRDAAEQRAADLWQSGRADNLAEEWARLEEVRVVDAPDEEACGHDCDEVLRFLRDRELVIEALDPDAFNPTVHDALSADDVARHLEWSRADGTPDVPRASRSLERLCAAHRVVCFTRPRVRRGERGEIRLHCTPQHLERLSSLLDLPGDEGEQVMTSAAESA
ncbi:MAG: hypothetical protein M3483_01020 [Gemmatimonadota bacterium]|nr:hypothetical protein [Gemmatimonadota bacterium]